MPGVSILKSLRLHKCGRLFWAGFFLVLAVVASLSWVFIQNYYIYFGQYYDDGIYMVSAKSLADGLGYRIISVPGEPAQTKYPIGYPLLLALVWKIFPDFPQNLMAFATLHVALAVCFVLVTAAYLIATRKVTPALGLTIFAVCALNHRLLDSAPKVLSDLPCALATVIAMWVTEVIGGKSFRLGSAVVLGLVLALVPTVRLQGLAAVLACLTYLLLKRRFRIAMVAAASAAAVLVPQLLWRLSERASAPLVLSYYTGYFSIADQAKPSLSQFLPFYALEFTWNMFVEINSFFPYLYEFLSNSLSQETMLSLFYVIYLPLLALLFWGGFLELKRGSLIGLYLLFYASPGLVFPAHLQWRHVAAVLPLGYYVYFRAFRSIGKALRPDIAFVRKPYLWFCKGVLFVFCTYLLVGATLMSLYTAGSYQYDPVRKAGWFSPQVANSDYQEAFAWIKAQTKPTDTFVSNNDPILSLYTGRKTVYPFRVDFWMNYKEMNVDLLEGIQYAHADYVMVDPLYPGAPMPVSAVDWVVLNMMQKAPGSLTPVFTSSHKLVRIYSVHWSKLKWKGKMEGKALENRRL